MEWWGRIEKVVKLPFIPRPDHLCYDIEKKLMEPGGSKVVKLLFIPRPDQLCYDIENFQVGQRATRVINTKDSSIVKGERGHVVDYQD